MTDGRHGLSQSYTRLPGGPGQGWLHLEAPGGWAALGRCRVQVVARHGQRSSHVTSSLAAPRDPPGTCPGEGQQPMGLAGSPRGCACGARTLRTGEPGVAMGLGQGTGACGPPLVLQPPLGWLRCSGRVELPNQVLLVDFAHLVPWDLLHQQKLRGDGVGGQGASGPLLEVPMGQ